MTPSLDEAGILATVDLLVLRDLCVVVARLDQAERTLSLDGLITPGGHRHPASILVHQLRGRLDRLVVQLGLSPVARLRMNGVAAGVAAGDDEQSPYDV